MLGDTDNYYYDQTGRRQKIVTRSGSLISTTTYTYSPNLVGVGRLDSRTYKFDSYTYYLNQENLADSVTYSLGTVSLSPSGKDVYTYNADGYLTKYISTGDRTLGAETDSFDISGGNVVGRWYKYSDTESYKMDGGYQYDLAHSNSLNNQNLGVSFLGKTNKNAVISEYGESYQNFYDAQDRIIMRVISDSNPYSKKDTERITYY